MHIGHRKRLGTFIVILITSLILQMSLHYKIFQKLKRRSQSDDYRMPESDVLSNTSYIAGLYYSNWSPYEPRLHFPHDIDFEKVSHIYYAFLLIDPETGKLTSSDEWSDTQLNLAKQCREYMFKRFTGDELKAVTNIRAPPGCIGELNYLRYIYSKIKKRNVKLIMSVGGWSNRESFPIMVRDELKLKNFINSCIETMVYYGFDGIDLDWEFPEDDSYEPDAYLRMARELKLQLQKLEANILGDHSNKTFQLSMATPAFKDKLSILPIHKLDKYIDLWNLMTYDYYGEWSERTGLHANLYNEKGKLLHLHRHDEDAGLSGDAAINYMVNRCKIDPRKVILGMAAYGRGFTNVDMKSTNPHNPYGLKFSGVGGASEGEPGMWLYNQLPIPGSNEKYDYRHVGAYCYDDRTHTLVGYDNPTSVIEKANYIMSNSLGGAFWWESCGDTHKNPKRSLLNTYIRVIRNVKNNKETIYSTTNLHDYYLENYDTNGFLTGFIKDIIQES